MHIPDKRITPHHDAHQRILSSTPQTLVDYAIYVTHLPLSPCHLETDLDFASLRYRPCNKKDLRQLVPQTVHEQ